MKALIIKDEFPAGDCWDCLLALANLNECAHDDYCPLHDVVDIHSKRIISKELYKYYANDRESLETFLEEDMAKHVGYQIKTSKLCSISSKMNDVTNDYEKYMTVLVLNPKEEVPNAHD